MKVVTGELWSEEGKAGIILVTTNGIINSQGRLVMGRGAAQEAASRYPLLPTELAERIKPYNDEPYGLIILAPYANGVQLGAFQVKHHWQQPADLMLISFSAELLRTFAMEMPATRIAMNYPGIGNGKLSEAEVRRVLESSNLPDNVIIYKKGKNADQNKNLRASH